MKLTGTTHQFLGNVLPPDYRQEIFVMVETAWTRVPNPFAAWLEPRITGLLRLALIEEQESRYDANPPFHISEDVKKRDPKTGKEIERSDVEICLRHHYIKGQKPYFVFESKRLNIPYDGRIKPNADEYVGEGGMGCLLAGHYETVPNFSGMLAYVMDGNPASARRAVDQTLQRMNTQLGLTKTARIEPSNFSPKSRHNGITNHHIGTLGKFVVFHLFLSVRRPKNGLPRG